MYPAIHQLVNRVRPLDMGDSIAKAGERLRTSTCGAVPVCVSGRVLGIVTGKHVAQALDGHVEESKRLPVAMLQPQAVNGIPDYWQADQALSHMRRENLTAVPVVDAAGRYTGMLGVGDLAAAVCGRLRPRSIGGMATPFGVYLTDGTVRGGVGDRALVAAGIFIGGLQILGAMFAWMVAGKDGILSRLVPSESLARIIQPEYLEMGLLLLFFAIAFRLSWVCGLHAAEHQVVHTLEAGDDLRTSVVKSKPRVHPRCGTNLVVGFMLATALWRTAQWPLWQSPDMAQYADLACLVGVLLILFAWRRLGSVVQQYVTTRPATDAQLRNGIRAGEELMQRFQASGEIRPSRLLRFWNMGLCQIMAGYAILLSLLFIIDRLFPIPALQGVW